MHDPMVVAFEIRRPWPRISRIRDSRPRGNRGAFWRIGNTELYWPGMLTVWHVEPGGADAFDVCERSSRWQWHVHHWRLQFAPWQAFRRWAFDRCAWCGGPSRRGNLVNVSHSWDGKKPKHWWQSRAGVFHRDCSSVEQAHRTCVCSLIEGRWANGSLEPYGHCRTCGGFRRMGSASNEDFDVHTRTTEMMQAIPKGSRNLAVIAEVERLWRDHRAAQRSDS
ncbi:MAG: hypothetical protein K0S49_36 [Microbacterium sp.]|jgi:hypothetical protein|nr:hypothetical protein [Microbacterium sp.]